MKTNNFNKVISQLNKVADYFIDENGNRGPWCIIARALRTIASPDAKTFDDNNLIYEVQQLAIELIIKTRMDYTWFIENNICLPPLDKKEIEDVKNLVNAIKEANKKYM